MHRKIQKKKNYVQNFASSSSTAFIHFIFHSFSFAQFLLFIEDDGKKGRFNRFSKIVEKKSLVFFVLCFSTYMLVSLRKVLNIPTTTTNVRLRWQSFCCLFTLDVCWKFLVPRTILELKKKTAANHNIRQSVKHELHNFGLSCCIRCHQHILYIA